VTAPSWHCKQIPNGPNPMVVCEREALMRENGLLRSLVRALADGACLRRDDRPAWERIVWVGSEFTFELTADESALFDAITSPTTSPTEETT
jgi:hypothetical protein